LQIEPTQLQSTQLPVQAAWLPVQLNSVPDPVHAEAPPQVPVQADGLAAHEKSPPVSMHASQLPVHRDAFGPQLHVWPAH